MLEFFTAQINNDHTRKAYLNATRRFAEWCETHGINELADVQPFHVAAFVKELQGQFSPPTVKQHLAALRMLFDWLVTGHVIDVNPAHAVRGPKYVVKKGKTPVLDADEARAAARLHRHRHARPGLRDRALIGVMVYTFARVNAVIGMKVKDYFIQGRRGWVRLHEKGGKEHEVPCHHNLEKLPRRIYRRRRDRRRRRTARYSARPAARPARRRPCGSRTLPDDPAPGRGRRHQGRRDREGPDQAGRALRIDDLRRRVLGITTLLWRRGFPV